jgi:hypothetical protein
MSVNESAEGWTIRVLDRGRVRKTAPLGPGRITIGHAFTNDVVIRDSGDRTSRVALDLANGSPARLEILDGEASLLGQVLAAPATALLPAYTPLSLGDSQWAYGQQDDFRWAEAERLAKAVQSGLPDGAAELGAAASSTPDKSSEGRVGRSVRAYAPLILGVMACGFVAVGLNVHPPGTAFAAAPSGARPPLATLKHPNVVSRAEDIFLSAGIRAKATTDGRGGVAVSVSRDADPLIVDQARRKLLLETPSPKRVDIAFGAQAEAAAATSAAKRIVAAVSGADGYLAAADGSKYFVGARLPTGQVLKAVGRDSILFEQNGLTTQLNFPDGDSK